MSFPKAKITRFNDGIPCAPPPGTYNPELPNKNVGPVIYKTERFVSNCNGDSKKGSRQFLYSSNESLSSLSEHNETTPNGHGSFKTPRLPFCSLKPLSNSTGKRKVDFVNRKAVSSENMSEMGDDTTPSLKSSSLKYGLNIIQDELILEKNRTEKLIREISRAKKENEHCEQFTDSMIELFLEKEKLVEVLREKYDALWSLVANDSSSHHQHVLSAYEIIEKHMAKDHVEANASYVNLIDGYERILTDYERDFDDIYVFLTELIRSHKALECEELNIRDDNIVNQLIDEVKEAEKKILKYEWSVRNMERVMAVLKERVAESDYEVSQKYDEMRTLHESNARLINELKEKDELVASMRNVHDTLAHTLVNEVQIKERDLLLLVDEFKRKVLIEKNDLERALANERETVQAVKAELNANELALQEALDRIDILKCKEDNLVEQLARLRDESSVERVLLEADLCEYQDRLEQLTKCGSESSFGRAQFALRNDNMFAYFVNQITNFVNEKFSNGDKVELEVNNEQDKNPLHRVKHVVVENLRNLCNKQDVEWIDELLNMTYDAFYKLAAVNAYLQKELGRSRDDFLEKCDECAQITRLLHVIENGTEQVPEPETNGVKRLTNGELNGVHVEDAPIKDDDDSSLAKRVAELESLLVEERLKNEKLVLENSKLEKLVGPYRENLEMYESESVNHESTNENLHLIQKCTRIMDENQRNVNLQQIFELSNNVGELKKPDDKSSKRTKAATTTSTKRSNNTDKENVQLTKKKECKMTKNVVKDMLNKNMVAVGDEKQNNEAKVLLTSPKVNRL